MACKGSGCPESNYFRQEDFNWWVVCLFLLYIGVYVLRRTGPDWFFDGLRWLLGIAWRSILGLWRDKAEFDDLGVADTAKPKDEVVPKLQPVVHAVEQRADAGLAKPSGKSRKKPTRLDPNRTEELLASLMESLYNEEPLYDEAEPFEDVSISKVDPAPKVDPCVEEDLSIPVKIGGAKPSKQRRAQSRGKSLGKTSKVGKVEEFEDVIKPTPGQMPTDGKLGDTLSSLYPTNDGKVRSFRRRRSHSKPRNVSEGNDDVTYPKAHVVDVETDAIKPKLVAETSEQPHAANAEAGMFAPSIKETSQRRLASPRAAGEMMRRALASPTASPALRPVSALTSPPSSPSLLPSRAQCLVPCEFAACDWIGASEDLANHTLVCQHRRPATTSRARQSSKDRRPRAAAAVVVAEEDKTEAMVSCPMTDYEKHIATCPHPASSDWETPADNQQPDPAMAELKNTLKAELAELLEARGAIPAIPALADVLAQIDVKIAEQMQKIEDADELDLQALASTRSAPAAHAPAAAAPRAPPSVQNARQPGVPTARTRARAPHQPARSEENPDSSWTEVRASPAVRRAPALAPPIRLIPGAAPSPLSNQPQPLVSQGVSWAPTSRGAMVQPHASGVVVPHPSGVVRARSAGPSAVRAHSAGPSAVASAGRQSSATPAGSSQRARSEAPDIRNATQGPEFKSVPNYNSEVGSLRSNAGSVGIKAYSGSSARDPRPLYQRPFEAIEAEEFPSLGGSTRGNAHDAHMADMLANDARMAHGLVGNVYEWDAPEQAAQLPERKLSKGSVHFKDEPEQTERLPDRQLSAGQAPEAATHRAAVPVAATQQKQPASVAPVAASQQKQPTTVVAMQKPATVAAAHGGVRPDRLAVLESIFRILDADQDGHLNSRELLQFARLTGFDADDTAWKDEYRLLCQDVNVNPSDGFNFDRFVAVVDDSSEHGCPCTDTELHDIVKKLGLSSEASKPVPEREAAPEVSSAAPRAPQPAKVDKKAGQQKKKDVAPPTAVVVPADADDDGFWEDAPVRPEAISVPLAQCAPEQTQHTSGQTHLKGGGSSKVLSQQSDTSAVRSNERPVAKDDDTIHDSSPVRTNRFGKQLARGPLINSIFLGLDLDQDGILCSGELRRFAELSGFDGGDEEWDTEFRLLCEEWQHNASGGITDAVFAEMVNDRSNSGCYCSDQELAAIARKVSPTSVKRTVAKRRDASAPVSSKLLVDAPSRPEVAASPSAPSDKRRAGRSTVKKGLPPVGYPPANAGLPSVDAPSTNVEPSSTPKVQERLHLSSELKQASPPDDDDWTSPPRHRAQGPSRVAAQVSPDAKVAPARKKSPDRKVPPARKKTAAWIPQLRPAVAPAVSSKAPAAASSPSAASNGPSVPSEETHRHEPNPRPRQAQTFAVSHDDIDDDDEWDDGANVCPASAPTVQPSPSAASNGKRPPSTSKQTEEAQQKDANTPLQRQVQTAAVYDDDDEWEDMEPAVHSQGAEEDRHAQQLEAKGNVDEDGSETGKDFINTCGLCGETWLMAFDLGEEFECEDTGKPCGADASKAAASTFLFTKPEEENANAEDAASNLRTRLLCRVLAEGLTALDAADLFLSQGLEPAQPAELEACRDQLHRRRAERAAEIKDRAASEVAFDKQRKKQQRYLNGQLVDVPKGSKYLKEPKESTEDRQKTSCSIVIQGRHSHPERSEKKGPRS